MLIFRNKSYIKNMTEYDRKILKFFFGVFTTFFVGFILIGLIISEPPNVFDVVSGSGYISVLFTFFITGVLAYKYYKKSAIIPIKKLWTWVSLIAFAIAIIALIPLLLFGIPASDFPKNIGFLAAMVIMLYLAITLVIYVIIVALFFTTFGMVGFLSALIRGLAPEILLHVSRISTLRDSPKGKKKKNARLNTEDSIINWAFAIPDVLDTKTLKINSGRPRHRFPWSSFHKAIFWQTLFGAVVIVYISLNPLYVKTELDFQNLFNLASNITIFIPFIILPWFIFLRLDAKIKGPVKDYELYRGIVYRIYQTFFTLGTIIIILRLGLERINPQIILLTIPIYYIFFVSTMCILTFIYFNFLENGLAWHVAKRYRKIKD